jgi:S-adenosylmethionine-dependent methyltransferase
MKMTANAESERFRGGADKYAAYLETAEGRLRLDLGFANLQDFLPPAAKPLVALDLGGGTGAMSVRLARLGLQVTLLDTSLPMLEFAERAAQAGGVKDRVVMKHGDAAQLASLFPAEFFDVVLCHNVLEYVDDPDAVLLGASRIMRDRSSILSILVRSQAGEVLKAAIKEGDLTAAEHNLTAEWTHESLYGGRVRLFTAEGLRASLTAASLTATGERGVRVMSDYLPPQISRDAEYERILELERKLGKRPEFARMARYSHWLAHRRDAEEKDSR